MPPVAVTRIPLRQLTRTLDAGIAAIAANPEEWDQILGDDVSAEELGRAKSDWTTRPPTVRVQMPHADTPMPAIIVLRQGNDLVQPFLGEGYEIDTFDGELTHFGHQRRSGVWGIHAIGVNTDAVEWTVAAVQRILDASTPRFQARNMTCSVLSITDLAMDLPNGMIPLFVQRLTVRLEWDAYWPRKGALWEALNGAVTSPSIELDVDVNLPYTLGGG